MRIARFSTSGHDPRYGLVELTADQGEHPDTITVLDRDPLAGPVQATGERVDLADARLLAPVIPRSKVVGLAYNYPSQDLDAKPVSFIKPNTTVIGPEESIVRPGISNDLRYEAELAIVIGRFCRSVPVERAHEVIFGYTCANDVTAHDLRQSDGQWTRSKSFDTFTPLGPWIVSHLSLEEVSNLMISAAINDEETGRGKTSRMVMGIAETISYVTSFMTLLPGDVIVTGSPLPAGSMAPGDQVTIDIDQIGTLTNTVVDDQ